MHAISLFCLIVLHPVFDICTFRLGDKRMVISVGEDLEQWAVQYTITEEVHPLAGGEGDTTTPTESTTREEGAEDTDPLNISTQATIRMWQTQIQTFTG